MEDSNVLDSNYSEGNSQIAFTGQSLAFLKEAGKWAQFLGIIGFIMIGMMILLGLSMGTIMSSMMGSVGGDLSGTPGMEMVGPMYTGMFIFLAAIYLYPTLKLFRFGKLAKAAIASNDTEQMTDALENLKSMFKFMGILTAVTVGLYALIFIVGLAGMAVM